MKKVYIYRIVTFVLLVSLMVVIFSFSAQTANESRKTSTGFKIILFEKFYPHFKEFSKAKQQEILDSFSFPVRKAAHFSLYFTLGLFSFLFIVSFKSFKMIYRFILSFEICLLYSISDEIHQIFVPGRGGMISDVLIDCSGTLLCLLILFYIIKNKKIRKLVE